MNIDISTNKQKFKIKNKIVFLSILNYYTIDVSIN